MSAYEPLHPSISQGMTKEQEETVSDASAIVMRHHPMTFSACRTCLCSGYYLRQSTFLTYLLHLAWDGLVQSRTA